MGGSANLQAVSKPQVYVTPAGAVAVGSPFYAAHYLTCIKLRDISDHFKKCPIQKNTRGFIYLNYNRLSTTLVTTGTAGVVAPATIDMLWNFSSGAKTTTLAGGLALPASAVTLTITADVTDTPTAAAGITPSQSFSSLLTPTYSPNPSADHALAQRKIFRYFERINNKFTAATGASFTWTVSNAMANLKRLIMQPVSTNPTAGDTVSDLINPFRSPFSTVPATTSPFAALKHRLVTVGNVPIWNNPVSFGYDLFVQEMSKSGIDGGLDDVTSASWLSQRQWESLYRFVGVDFCRRPPSENGASKSIIVSGTSNCSYALTIYYHILREAVASVDTAMCTVSQGTVNTKIESNSF
ncbi:hypothetical protein GN244_ATG14475 [Phytophthora infestans]|uniref:Uncharacterized protein n=1 Tax=Phytophthora infestans TaxID=4787 RepID=A0A833W981_PHYIN|nr:hypothetical protein GN244_ATG14475 [Phytophthora infestans]